MKWEDEECGAPDSCIETMQSGFATRVLRTGLRPPFLFCVCVVSWVKGSASASGVDIELIEPSGTGSVLGRTASMTVSFCSGWEVSTIETIGSFLFFSFLYPSDFFFFFFSFLFSFSLPLFTYRDALILPCRRSPHTDRERRQRRRQEFSPSPNRGQWERQGKGGGERRDARDARLGG